MRLDPSVWRADVEPVCEFLSLKHIQRLRHRYGEILREEVANTVSSPDDVDADLRYLLTVLEG